MALDKDYYYNEIQEKQTEKEILLQALQNIARSEFPNFILLDQIAEKLSAVNSSIKWNTQQLQELMYPNQKDKSEQNDN